MKNYTDRMIQLGRIEPNPMRDMSIYPIHMDRIEKLAASYQQGDFGTIIPVRPHPTKAGVYQQACGHHRLAAMQHKGFPLEIMCRVADYSDADMADIMVRENMNNFGNNPEAVADSVAAVCTVISYWLFIADSFDVVSRILDTSHHSPFCSEKSFNAAKGTLVRDSTIGERAVSNFFGPNKDDRPLTQTQVQGSLAALNATGKMAEIIGLQRTRAERELEAKLESERRRAEDAERKAEEARIAEEAFKKAEAEHQQRRRLETIDARKLKDEADRKREEARIAAEKAEEDAIRRRRKVAEKERARLELEAAAKLAKQKSVEQAQEKAEKSKTNAAERQVEPWLHSRSYGMFDNQEQFIAFRQMMSNQEYRALFPVDQQPEIIDAMKTQIIAVDGGVTGKGIRSWMLAQNEEHAARIAAANKEREDRAQAEREARIPREKAERIVGEACSALARMSNTYRALHEAMSDPVMADHIMAAPHSETLRHSLEQQYKMLPELEKLFNLQARRFRPQIDTTTEERIINA